MLQAKDIMVGRRYRSKNPQVRHTLHKDVWDDRIVTWIPPEWDMVFYREMAGGPPTSISMVKFLDWAARGITWGETSDAH